MEVTLPIVVEALNVTLKGFLSLYVQFVLPLPLIFFRVVFSIPYEPVIAQPEPDTEFSLFSVRKE